MNFNVEQSTLDEETLANLWSFVKSASVSPLQGFPLCGAGGCSCPACRLWVIACSHTQV